MPEKTGKSTFIKLRGCLELSQICLTIGSSISVVMAAMTSVIVQTILLIAGLLKLAGCRGQIASYGIPLKLSLCGGESCDAHHP